MKYKIFHGDCLHHLKNIPKNSVDLILTDPPYGTTAAHWDKVIDFEKFWSETDRILTHNGSAILTASQPFTTMLISSNIEQFKYCLVWEKSRGSNFVHSKYQPMKTHEDIVVFSKGGCAQGSKNPMIFNPQFVLGKSYVIKARDRKSNIDTMSKGNIQSKIAHHNNEGKRNPRSVLYFTNAADAEGGAFHPTQKPIALFEYLVMQYSNSKSIVLDPFMGSGTTGVATIKAQRKFIGIEKESKYYSIAERRINELAKMKKLF